MAGVDICGNAYDSTWTDSEGERHYRRDRARGTAAGPALWSDSHDVNPICGHHLASKCDDCKACLTCDGCYCNEP